MYLQYSEYILKSRWGWEGYLSSARALSPYQCLSCETVCPWSLDFVEAFELRSVLNTRYLCGGTKSPCCAAVTTLL